MYIIKSTSISGITLSSDEKSIDINQAITFNKEGETVLPDGNTGNTVNLSLETGERNTMLAELQSKTTEWFNSKFNPIQ